MYCVYGRESGCGCFAWRKFVKQDNLRVVRADTNCLPSRFHKLGSECSKVCTSKDTSKIPFLDSSLMAVIPDPYFIGKLLLQLCKAHDIQPLENVCTMCWVNNQLDVQLPSFPEKFKRKMRGMPI